MRFAKQSHYAVSDIGELQAQGWHAYDIFRLAQQGQYSVSEIAEFKKQGQNAYDICRFSNLEHHISESGEPHKQKNQTKYLAKQDKLKSKEKAST